MKIRQKSLKKSSPFKLLGHFGQNFDGMVVGWSPFQNCIQWPCQPIKMAAISQHSFNIGPYGKNVLKSTLKLLGQLWPNFNGIVLSGPFQNYIHWPYHQTKMAAISRHRENVWYLENCEKWLLKYTGKNVHLDKDYILYICLAWQGLHLILSAFQDPIGKMF